MVQERPEVIVASSTVEQTIGVWDLQTSTFLSAYKGNQSGRNALALLGRDFFIAAQAGKAQALHAWSWHKDPVHLRSFTPESISTVACTQDGAFCAAGGEKGNIYIWETGTGRLLRSFPAHYKSVAVLRFTDDSAVLVSAGEDAVVSTWLLMSLLDASSQHNPIAASPQPLYSWSQHTLPVTGLHIGGGAPSAAVVASVSLDRTCNIWSLGQGRLLRSMALPEALQCVTTDPWEHCLYLGASDGQIFEASLLERREGGAAASTSGDVLAEAGIHTLVGHFRAVTCLATSGSGYHLVSGSEDGTLRVWDLQSRQVLRIIQAKGPVSALLVLKKPLHMTAGRDAESGRRGPPRAQALAQLKKYMDNLEPWQGPPVIVDGTQPYRSVVTKAGLLHVEQPGGSEQSALQAGGGGAEFARLVAEHEALQTQLRGAADTISELRAANAKLHAFVVESSLAE